MAGPQNPRILRVKNFLHRDSGYGHLCDAPLLDVRISTAKVFTIPESKAWTFFKGGEACGQEPGKSR